MLKNKYLSFALSLISLPALGMSMSDAHISNLSSQLNHVNAQINASKRAWNESRVRIKMAEKTSPSLFIILKQIFEKIIASDDFTQKMNTTVDQQFESIVNNSMSFSAVKTENNLSDFYSKPMHTLGLQLYTAMANKAYYLLLGEKLAQKSKQLAVTIISLQQKMANEQQDLSSFLP